MSLALRSNLSSPSLSFPVLPVPRFLPLQLLSPYHTPFHTPLLYLCLSRCSFLALLSLSPSHRIRSQAWRGGWERKREREPESALSASLLDGVVSRESSRVTVVTGGVTSLHRRLLCHQLQSWARFSQTWLELCAQHVCVCVCAACDQDTTAFSIYSSASEVRLCCKGGVDRNSVLYFLKCVFFIEIDEERSWYHMT